MRQRGAPGAELDEGGETERDRRVGFGSDITQDRHQSARDAPAQERHRARRATRRAQPERSESARAGRNPTRRNPEDGFPANPLISSSRTHTHHIKSFVPARVRHAVRELREGRGILSVTPRCYMGTGFHTSVHCVGKRACERAHVSREGWGAATAARRHVGEDE